MLRPDGTDVLPLVTVPPFYFVVPVASAHRRVTVTDVTAVATASV